ncbi:MAG: YbaB/EbfC family nucleoid-associated protein [Dehalococcoidia bacterium]|jgi:DNA-binding YbaB/EbfC family protein
MKMNRDMMRQIQQMQSRLAKAQEELANLTAEGSAGGGAVKATVSGSLEIRSLKISPEVVDPEDVEMLEDLVIAAFNEALQKAQALQTEHMAGLTSGLNLPGMR